jgi:hypothetical protein
MASTQLNHLLQLTLLLFTNLNLLKQHDYPEISQCPLPEVKADAPLERKVVDKTSSLAETINKLVTLGMSGLMYMVRCARIARSVSNHHMAQQPTKGHTSVRTAAKDVKLD